MPRTENFFGILTALKRGQNELSASSTKIVYQKIITKQNEFAKLIRFFYLTINLKLIIKKVECKTLTF